LLLISAFSFSCSSKKIPTAPKAAGKITIRNESGTPLVLENYRHTRGDRSQVRHINLELRYYGSSYTLINLLDGTNSRYFEGGDKVSIRYEALVDQPGHPGIPLFSGSLDVEVNGNTSFKFTSGGNIQEQ
jgi:hypothetical protein